MSGSAHAAPASDDLASLIGELETEYSQIREFTPSSGPAGRSQTLATTFFMGCCVTD